MESYTDLDLHLQFASFATNVFARIVLTIKSLF